MVELKSNFKILMMAVVFICLANRPLDAYEKPNYASKETWEAVKPYLLPEDDPAKAVLDEIFASSRAILNLETMKEAGFIELRPRKYNHVIVCKHTSLPGYIIKTYLDSQRFFKKITEDAHWIRRIEGRELINEIIGKHHLQNYFKCPKKWIYPLPENPSPPEEFIRKNFILVEEDMDILDDQENYTMWLSKHVTRDFLNAFYYILEEAGLSDSVRPHNAPFSIDGKVAFIDTEIYQSWPVHYKQLKKYLSPKMKSYWKKLTKKSKDLSS